jgi:glycosyltransferase involved in cell wall biosynthesis
VLYWFTQPTPYVVARFNAAVDRPELEFYAIFSTVRQSDRSWEVDEMNWRFPGRYLGRLKVPLKELLSVRPDVFVLEYDRWNLAVGALLGLMTANRVIFRVLPNFDAWSKRTWWREIGKHVLFRAIDGAKVPGPDGAALAKRYGVPANRIGVVTQSVSIRHYGRSRDMTRPERSRRREELGLSGCVFAYVGRIWAGKGLDELFRAYLRVRAERDDVSLLVIGDGVDFQRYCGQYGAAFGVKMVGFVQPADLPEYYALCDTLVFPTHGDPNGLVLEEALAAGLPVIASDAAGDVKVRLPGSVGRVFPVGNVDALTDAMHELADPSVRELMAKQAPDWVEDMHDQRYAEDLARFVMQVAETRRRRILPGIAHLGLQRTLRLAESVALLRSRR